MTKPEFKKFSNPVLAIAKYHNIEKNDAYAIAHQIIINASRYPNGHPSASSRENAARQAIYRIRKERGEDIENEIIVDIAELAEIYG